MVGAIAKSKSQARHSPSPCRLTKSRS